MEGRPKTIPPISLKRQTFQNIHKHPELVMSRLVIQIYAGAAYSSGTSIVA